MGEDRDDALSETERPVLRRRRAQPSDRRCAQIQVVTIEEAVAALETVYGSFGPEHGFSHEEVAAAERRLGFALPGALRVLYLRTGKHPFHSAENAIIPLEALDFGGDYLPIYDENQGVCQWVIANSALGEQDPPVDMSATTFEGHEYLPEFVSVTHFLLSQAATQAVATLPFSGLVLETRRPAPSREAAQIIGEILWRTEHADIRARPGAISFITDGYFSVAARDEPTFTLIASALGLEEDDWSYLSSRDG